MATSNLRKAAVLLSSLPREQAAGLLDRLGPEQVAAVTAEMDTLQQVEQLEQETVAQEFAAARGTCHDDVLSPGDTPFAFLGDVPDDDILCWIADEHPQTIALILSCLQPRQAAAVLAGLSPDDQFSVVCRIAAMEEPSAEVLRDVQEGLRSRLRPSRIRRATIAVLSAW